MHVEQMRVYVLMLFCLKIYAFKHYLFTFLFLLAYNLENFI